MILLSKCLSFVQISCASLNIYSPYILHLIEAHYYIETCRRAYICTVLGTLSLRRGLGQHAYGSVGMVIIFSCHPSCPMHTLSGLPGHCLSTCMLTLKVWLGQPWHCILLAHWVIQNPHHQTHPSTGQYQSPKPCLLWHHHQLMFMLLHWGWNTGTRIPILGLLNIRN